MKKLLFAIMLTGSAAFGQTFSALPFLNVPALSVSNTIAYTNTAPFFGMSPIATTNSLGLQYTNRNGTLITTASNAVSGLVTSTNGTGVYTNDVTQLALDIPFHADRNGNVCTNYMIGACLSANNTTTGNVVAVFAPILQGAQTVSSFSSAVPTLPTVLDTVNTTTVNFPIARGGSTNVGASVNWSAFAGYRGMRLLSLSVTNPLGQVWVRSIAVSTFVP